MDFPTESYVEQVARWPSGGRHILAHYDAETIVVYQAYRPAIGNFAIEHGRFGGQFSYSRMSWIKPNFLWMMYRSGWGTKQGQEVILGLRLRRRFFEQVLTCAVASRFDQTHFTDYEIWKAAVQTSEVRLQWDPDHDPQGNAVSRRAIQLGLRGSTLKAYGENELLEVVDMTEFVKRQREHLLRSGPAGILMPVEKLYLPNDEAVKDRVKLD